MGAEAHGSVDLPPAGEGKANRLPIICQADSRHPAGCGADDERPVSETGERHADRDDGLDEGGDRLGHRKAPVIEILLEQPGGDRLQPGEDQPDAVADDEQTDPIVMEEGGDQGRGDDHHGVGGKAEGEAGGIQLGDHAGLQLGHLQDGLAHAELGQRPGDDADETGHVDEAEVGWRKLVGHHHGKRPIEELAERLGSGGPGEAAGQGPIQAANRLGRRRAHGAPRRVAATMAAKRST